MPMVPKLTENCQLLALKSNLWLPFFPFSFPYIWLWYYKTLVSWVRWSEKAWPWIFKVQISNQIFRTLAENCQPTTYTIVHILLEFTSSKLNIRSISFPVGFQPMLTLSKLAESCRLSASKLKFWFLLIFLHQCNCHTIRYQWD